jgi:TonB family protein
MNFIGRNIRYPIIAQENGIQGRVIVRFVVSSTGKVSDVQVLRSLDPSCDKEAVRVIKMLPEWIPGEQNGEKVAVYYTLPISFKLKSQQVKGSISDFKNALIIIDDKATAEDFNINSIQPTNIESISVLKPDSDKVQGLITKYGERAKKGVILIKTKKDGAITYNKENIKTNSKDSITAFTVIDKMPMYPGGEAALLNFISSNLKYPLAAQVKGIQGKVILRFVILKTGKVSNVEVLRSLYPACDNEAIRVIQMLEGWIPGEQKGEKVSVYYTLPISFKLQ